MLLLLDHCGHIGEQLFRVVDDPLLDRVQPVVETDPSPSPGDTADDSVIWIHPVDPSLSLVIGDDKDGGLMVWGLDGRQLEYVDGTRYNNIDLRYNFPLAGSFSDGNSHTHVALVGVGDEGNSEIDQPGVKVSAFGTGRENETLVASLIRIKDCRASSRISYLHQSTGAADEPAAGPRTSEGAAPIAV